MEREFSEGKGIATLYGIPREDFTERLMREQTSAGSVDSTLHIEAKNSLGRGNCKCKGPEERDACYVLETEGSVSKLE